MFACRSWEKAQRLWLREYRRRSPHTTNPAYRAAIEAGASALDGLNPIFIAHAELKRPVPGAIGLIRTGDTIPYANMLLVSA